MYIELKRSRSKLFWHYVVKAKNGQTTLTSETYYSKYNAQRAAYHASKKLNIPIGKPSK